MTIVSHRHRFIFVKTRKTASTSIEIALSRFCGPEDVITRITPEDERIRASLGYPGPQNLEVTRPLSKPLEAKLRRKGKGVPIFYNHMPSAFIREAVGEEIWSSYTRFCLDRNPWDRVCSVYARRRADGEHYENISQFLRQMRRQTLSNHWLYAIDGQVAVSHVGRYEALETELSRLSERLGFGEAITLPKERLKATPTARPHYSEMLGAEDRDFIARLCRHEIDLLGYEFEAAD